MELLNKIIEKNISGKKVLGLFILTNLVYTFMLVFTIPKTMKFANGMKLLDMMPTGHTRSVRFVRSASRTENSSD